MRSRHKVFTRNGRCAGDGFYSDCPSRGAERISPLAQLQPTEQRRKRKQNACAPALEYFLDQVYLADLNVVMYANRHEDTSLLNGDPFHAQLLGPYRSENNH